VREIHVSEGQTPELWEIQTAQIAFGKVAPRNGAIELEAGEATRLLQRLESVLSELFKIESMALRDPDLAVRIWLVLLGSDTQLYLLKA
jgi:hypothetical protein